jgi:hypothetical protein
MADPANPFLKYTQPADGSDGGNPFLKYAMRSPDADASSPAASPGPVGAVQQPNATPMSWGDVASQAAANIPSSAYNVGASLVHTLAHPIQTAESLYDVGRGAVSKAEGAIGIAQDPETKAANEAAINAVRDFYVNRYGSIDKFKEALANDPAGVAMDLSTVLTGGEGVLARIPGAARAADAVGDAARVTNPVNAASKIVTGVKIPGTGLNVGIEPVASNILGMTTGAGTTPIRQAARAGFNGSTTFADNMRGNVPLSDAVDMAQSALGQMRQDRSAAYKADMASANAAPGHVGYQPIHQALADADAMVNFQGLAKSDDALNTLEQIKDKVSQWRGLPSAHTIEAADALKQAIGEIRQSTQPGTLSRRVADSVYNAAKSSIVQQAPEYAKAMSGYAAASDKIDDLTKTFSLGEKASTDTALRKLQSTTRNNVNTNYGERARLLDELAQYEPELPNALAGQSLSSATPRGMASRTAIELGGGGAAAAAMHFLNPAFLASLPFFSPRIVGEGAYAAGRAGNVLAPVVNALPGATKAGYVGNALSGGIGPRYDGNGNLR